jgi:glycosyltransferase involved in cell wall biosynthesis
MLTPRPQQPLAHHGRCGVAESPVAAESLSTRNPATLGPVQFVDHEVKDFLRHRMEMARRVLDAGFDVQVVLPNEPGIEEISRVMPVHIFHLKRTSTQPLDELRCCLSLLRIYRKVKPALVFHIGLKPSLYGGIAARLAGLNMVHMLTGLGYLFTSKTTKSRILRALVMQGLRCSFASPKCHTIFQNPENLQRMLTSGLVNRDRAVLIKGSGVDLTLFSPKPEPAGPPVVLLASRLLWEKGIGEFVAAAKAIREHGVQARFILLGEPDLEHPSAVPLTELAQWHEEGVVEYLGWRDDMPEWISQSHIVCLPTFYGEGVPRILIEGAASGRVVVATDTPGCREVVRDGHNGLLVPVGDVDALVDSLQRLITNAPLRAAMGRAGRELAVAEFSMDRVLDATMAVCTCVLGDYKDRLINSDHVST